MVEPKKVTYGVFRWGFAPPKHPNNSPLEGQNRDDAIALIILLLNPW
jgi:hypothetical protein